MRGCITNCTPWYYRLINKKLITTGTDLYDLFMDIMFPFLYRKPFLLNNSDLYFIVHLTGPYRCTNWLLVRYVPKYQHMVRWGILTNWYVPPIPILCWTNTYCPYRMVCHGTMKYLIQVHQLYVIFFTHLVNLKYLIYHEYRS